MGCPSNQQGSQGFKSGWTTGFLGPKRGLRPGLRCGDTKFRDGAPGPEHLWSPQGGPCHHVAALLLYLLLCVTALDLREAHPLWKEAPTG